MFHRSSYGIASGMDFDLIRYNVACFLNFEVARSSISLVYQIAELRKNEKMITATATWSKMTGRFKQLSVSQSTE